MNNDRRFQIAVAIGWYVFFTIILTTSGAVSSALAITLSYTQNFRYSNLQLDSSLISLALISSVVLIVLSAQLIFLVFRSWLSLIEITRSIVNYWFLNQSTSQDGIELENQRSEKEKQFIEKLFGNSDNTQKSLVWEFLRYIAFSWAIMLFLQLIVGVISTFIQ